MIGIDEIWQDVQGKLKYISAYDKTNALNKTYQDTR